MLPVKAAIVNQPLIYQADANAYLIIFFPEWKKTFLLLRLKLIHYYNLSVKGEIYSINCSLNYSTKISCEISQLRVLHTNADKPLFLSHHALEQDHRDWLRICTLQIIAC